MDITEMNQHLARKLNDTRLMADELPCALIIHRVSDLQVIYMNRTGLDILGTTLHKLQKIGWEQYVFNYFDQEDTNYYTPKIIDLIHSKENENQSVSYFQQVLVAARNEWQLFVSNTKVFARNPAGAATHLITTASLLDPVHHVTDNVNRLMDEVRFFRHNNELFSKLTKREKEVLKYMATGLNSGKIAERLFISPATADTHRKNIRNKLSIKNNYEAVKFAQAYGLI